VGFFTPEGSWVKHCVECKHFADAHHNKTYVTPRCTAQGDNDAMFMRQRICGVVEAILYQPKDHENLRHLQTQPTG
jgi:hypothetical protein